MSSCSYSELFADEIAKDVRLKPSPQDQYEDRYAPVHGGPSMCSLYLVVQVSQTYLPLEFIGTLSHVQGAPQACCDTAC